MRQVKWESRLSTRPSLELYRLAHCPRRRLCVRACRVAFWPGGGLALGLVHEVARGDGAGRGAGRLFAAAIAANGRKNALSFTAFTATYEQLNSQFISAQDHKV